MNYDPEEIVEFILARFTEGEKERAILEELVENYEIDEKTGKHAVEMVMTGFVRAGKIHAGEEFPASRNENDAFFKIAVKLGVEEFRKKDR